MATGDRVGSNNKGTTKNLASNTGMSRNRGTRKKHTSAQSKGKWERGSSGGGGATGGGGGSRNAPAASSSRSGAS